MMQRLDPSPCLHWRMEDGDVRTQWYPLGYALHAGGTGRLTVLVAATPLTCACDHTIAVGDIYISCMQHGRLGLAIVYCLEHAPRSITIQPA